MNLAPGELRDGRLRVAGIEIPLPTARARHDGARRSPAIRPTDLRPAGADDDAGLPRLRAELEVVERLGAESHVIFPVDAQRPAGEAAAAADEATEESDATLLAGDNRARFTARDPGPAPLLATARWSSSLVPPDALHLFDPDDRRRAVVSGDPAARRPVRLRRGRAPGVSVASRRSGCGASLTRTGGCTRSRSTRSRARRSGRSSARSGCASGSTPSTRRRSSSASGSCGNPSVDAGSAPDERLGARVRRACARARHRRAARRRRPRSCARRSPLRSRPTSADGEPARRLPVGPRSSRPRCATSERTAAVEPGGRGRGAGRRRLAATVAALLAAAGGLLGDAPAAAPPGAAALRCAAGPPRRSRRAPRRALRRPVQPVGADRLLLRGRARGRPTSARTRSRTSACGRWTSRSGWRRSSPTRGDEPFERRRELSRQLWDETRHAMMGEVALERQGVPFHSFPIEIQGSMALNTRFSPARGAPASVGDRAGPDGRGDRQEARARDRRRCTATRC